MTVWLPTELWIIILRFAVEITGALSMPWVSPVDDNTKPGDVNRFEYLASMRTRCRLILVSKGWHQHSLPLLYEIVWLEGRDQCLMFRTAVTGHPSRPGEYTKHFRLTNNGHYRHYLGEGTSLFDFLPNLSICVFHSIWHRVGSIHLMELFHHPRPALRHLQVIGAFIVSQEAMLRLASSASKLEFLHMDVIKMTGDITSSPTFSLPQLRYLRMNHAVVSWLERTVQRLSLPHLRELGGVGRYTQWPKLLDAPNVQALTYAESSPCEDIISACPCLEDVVYTTVPILFFRRPVPFRRIGLDLPPNGAGILLALLDHFVTINNPITYPSLVVIRMITWTPTSWEQRTRDFLEEELSFWMHWVRRWESRGIRLELRDGSLVELSDIYGSGDTLDEDYARFWESEGEGPQSDGDDESFASSSGSQVGEDESETHSVGSQN